jgi:hypothetical protein
MANDIVPYKPPGVPAVFRMGRSFIGFLIMLGIFFANICRPAAKILRRAVPALRKHKR